jgi:hypothetical protein
MVVDVRHSLDASYVVDIDQVEHARTVTECWGKTKVRPAEECADTLTTSRRQDQESCVACLRDWCQIVGAS